MQPLPYTLARPSLCRRSLSCQSIGLALPFSFGRFGGRFHEEALAAPVVDGSFVDLNPVWYAREPVRHFSKVQLCAASVRHIFDYSIGGIASLCVLS